MFESSARWWHRTASVHAGAEPQGSQAGSKGRMKLQSYIHWSGCQLISTTHFSSKHSLLCLPKKRRLCIPSSGHLSKLPASLGANLGTSGFKRPRVPLHSSFTPWGLRRSHHTAVQPQSSLNTKSCTALSGHFPLQPQKAQGLHNGFILPAQQFLWMPCWLQDQAPLDA